jgi:glutathione S-transferase
MRLFYDPISTTSRAVTLFIAEAGLDIDLVHVNLLAGEQQGEDFRALNPAGKVPVLRDGDFVLTESSAILKYLADAAGSPAYPADRQARARVNERMDWFNTGFSHWANYGLAYPALSPMFRLENPEAQAAVEHRARGYAAAHFELLDRHLIGENDFVCGGEMTIADCLGAAYVSLMDLVEYDLRPYPNVARWMTTMRSLPTWAETYAAFDGLMAALREYARQAG